MDRPFSFPMLLTLIVALASTGFAQENQPGAVPRVLSLREAMSLAQRNNPAHRQVENDRWAASWSVRNSYANFLPSVSASLGFNYSGAGAQRFLTSEFIQPSATVGSNYGVSLDWTLSGSTLMQPAVENARQEATEATINSSLINLLSNVTQQYLNVLQAEAEVELAEAQLVRNDESLRLARARHDVGRVTLLDVRQAEVLRGQSEVRLLQEKQDVIVEKLRIFQMMGIPAPADPSTVILSDSFAVVEPHWDLAELLTAAHEENADLNSLRSQQTAAAWGVRSAKSQWFPTIRFSAAWRGFTQSFANADFLVDQARAGTLASQASCETQNTIIEVVNQSGTNLLTEDCSVFSFSSADEQLVRNRNAAFPFEFTTQPFTAGVTISMPIFTNFDRSLQISRANVQLDDAREWVRARELQVRTDVSRAFYDVRTNHESIIIQQRNRTAVADQLRLATQRYRLGLGSFIELLDAQVAAEQAESDYISAVYNYHRSVAALEAAVGHPIR